MSFSVYTYYNITTFFRYLNAYTLDYFVGIGDNWFTYYKLALLEKAYTVLQSNVS